MSTQAMPLVDDIVAITKLETQGDAIIIVQDEIAYLDDLSLEGDIPPRHIRYRRGATERSIYRELSSVST
jgi:hypothetical protein